MSAFSVGEVALLHLPGHDHHMAEVTITAPAIFRVWYRWPDMDDTRSGIAYLVDVGDVEQWCVRPEHLRKRRPPQDWVRLCSLTDTPREVTCA